MNDSALKLGNNLLGVCGHCWSGWRQNVPTLSIISHLPRDNIHISAHVHPMNILQHQVLSDCTCASHEYMIAANDFLHLYIPWIYLVLPYCTCTSHQYITAANYFLMHMYIPGIYYCIKCFPTAHVHLINILHHQVLSDCTCTSHEYITAANTAHVHPMNILQHQGLFDSTRISQEYIATAYAFRLRMYISGIYYSIKCFSIAHVYPRNILQQQMFSDCTCTSKEYITSSSAFRLYMYIPGI